MSIILVTGLNRKAKKNRKIEKVKILKISHLIVKTIYRLADRAII
jgi:hypothetical protein